MSVPIKVAAAIVAWALLVWYWIVMKGIIDDVNAATTTAPEISAGIVRIATALGTGVVGVIAGLFGTAVPSGSSLMVRAPRRIGRTLTASFTPNEIAQMVIGVTYVLAYLLIVGLSISAWAGKGDALTPDFLEGQAIGAIGLLAACAVAKGGSD